MNDKITALVRRGTKCWIVLALGTGLFFFGGQGTAKSAGCPCSPCTCGVCHCGGGGGGGGKSGGGGGGGKGAKHDDHHGHHGHGGSGGGVGIGGSVDLGGIGQRHREADPFAVSGGNDSTTTPVHTQERHKPKKHDTEVATTDPFTDIHLTGQPAKGIAAKTDE